MQRMQEVKQRGALSWNAAARSGLLVAWDVGGLFDLNRCIQLELIYVEPNDFRLCIDVYAAQQVVAYFCGYIGLDRCELTCSGVN